MKIRIRGVGTWPACCMAAVLSLAAFPAPAHQGPATQAEAKKLERKAAATRKTPPTNSYST